MTIKDDNLRAIDHYYLTARERRAQQFVDTATAAERARTLESHLLREPGRKAQYLRDDVDYLLRYYSVLELASITGAIRELPAATRDTARRNLNDEYLRRYYERYYPQLLPQLLRARVSGESALTAGDDCTEDFLRFVALDASRDDENIETFLGFLDDYSYEIDETTHDLSSVVRAIAQPRRFVAALSADDEARTPTDEGVVGFLRFLSFSRDLDHLLRDVDDPLVRSCFWHYYGYWYQELGGQVLGALLTGIEILGSYVPATAATKMEARALERTHADMAAAVASLQLLTSSVYRVRLEEEVHGIRRPGVKEAEYVRGPAPHFKTQLMSVADRPDELRPPRQGGAARAGGSGGVAAAALRLLEPAVAGSIEIDRVYQALEDALSTAAREYYRTREPLQAVLDRSAGDVQIFAIREIVESEDQIEDPHAQWTLDQAREVDPDARIGGTIRLDYISKEVVDVVRDQHTQIGTRDARKIDPEAEHGDEIKIPLTTPPDLGRIAAQSAKQVLYQKVRETEREKIANEFKARIGELETGYVKRFERGDMIIDLNGRTEGIIPRQQQSHAERYSAGDRIKAVIVDAHTQPNGPQVVLSRTDPRLLIRLFELEVPEVYDGTVVIKDAAREAGEHAKIAVTSRERDIDAVAACAGMKGSRVQSVIRELRGEKIDIIPWHEDIVVYAANALAPAKITHVSVTSDEATHRPHLHVIVASDQLARAVGRRGLNVRLAAELIGAKIDIKSEEELKGDVADKLAAMLQEAMAEARAQTSVRQIANMPAEWARMLAAGGYGDLNAVLNASLHELTAIDGVDVEMAARIIDLAAEHERVEDASAEEDEPDGTPDEVADSEPEEAEAENDLR